MDPSKQHESNTFLDSWATFSSIVTDRRVPTLRPCWNRSSWRLRKRGPSAPRRPRKAKEMCFSSRVSGTKRILISHRSILALVGPSSTPVTTLSLTRNRWRSDGAKLRHLSLFTKPTLFMRMPSNLTIKELTCFRVWDNLTWIQLNRVTVSSATPILEVSAAKMIFVAL